MKKARKKDVFLEIKFGKSASKNYDKALKILKGFDNYQLIEKGSADNILKLDKRELRAKLNEFETLMSLIITWKTTEIYLLGDRVTLADYSKISLILKCNRGYYRSVIPRKYCFHYDKEGWGCKYLTEIERYFPNYTYQADKYTYWYHFGKFVSKNMWKINKDEIFEAIKREVELRNVDICDVYSLNNTKEIIDNLPDTIDLNESENWEPVYSDEIDAINNKAYPIAIKPKIVNKGFGFGISIGVDNLESEGETTKKAETTRNIPNVKFADIGGIDEIIQTIREVIELPLKRADLFEHLGIKPHKGIILFGPPGCGKTMIAKAIANEVNAHFIPINGPELLSKWYGMTEENLRNKFKEARELQPTVIYFDEIDSIAAKRSSSEEIRIDSRVVNQLLTLLDGIEDYGQVCILASTNRLELLDSAILRSGRFDYQLEIKKPNKVARVGIFKKLSTNMPISNDFNAEKYFGKLEGLSGADIAFLIREAAYNSMRRNLDLKAIIKDAGAVQEKHLLLITQNDFDKALNTLNVKLEENNNY